MPLLLANCRDFKYLARLHYGMSPNCPFSPYYAEFYISNNPHHRGKESTSLRNRMHVVAHDLIIASWSPFNPLFLYFVLSHIAQAHLCGMSHLGKTWREARSTPLLCANVNRGENTAPLLSAITHLGKNIFLLQCDGVYMVDPPPVATCCGSQG